MWTVALLAAVLLLIERVSYLMVWRMPERFRRLVLTGVILGQREPVDALRSLFVGFKIIQIGVFFGWCLYFGENRFPLPTADDLALPAGAIVLVVGQFLNFSVFWRLGKVGVFYGNRLGYEVPWVEGFPFSVMPHPQYLGTLASIWGFFLIMRYPYPDWLILPLVSTVYYLLAMRFERAVMDS